ncbi:hypothetical protein, partial [Nitrospirillum viridazoti]|uniref:hypothetical protein n=1 Tax=Nitrospirillum viridazoti TaxID=3144925 RepID=UPI0019D6E3C0
MTPGAAIEGVPTVGAAMVGAESEGAATEGAWGKDGSPVFTPAADARLDRPDAVDVPGMLEAPGMAGLAREGAPRAGAPKE